MSSDVSRILKEARDQGRLTTLEYAELILMISWNFMAIVILLMTVLLLAVSHA